MNYYYDPNDPDPLYGQEITPKGCLWQIIIAVVICLIWACFSSCSSYRNVEEETVIVHDTITQTITQRDSIWLQDSTYQEVIHKSDTVYLYKYKQKTEYRDRWLHDSIYIASTDTIYIKTVKEAQLTWWQKTKLSLGGCAFLLLALIALYYIGKFTINRFLRV